MAWIARILRHTDYAFAASLDPQLHLPRSSAPYFIVFSRTPVAAILPAYRLP
jgi:hypothetical protein